MNLFEDDLRYPRNPVLYIYLHFFLKIFLYNDNIKLNVLFHFFVFTYFRSSVDQAIVTTHKGEVTYDLIGQTVGTTNLYCHATKISGKELTSSRKEVQVCMTQ